MVRRGEAHGARSRVDWPKTLRRWARQGHSDGALVWRRTPRGPGRVVFLWDVSGSMAPYVEWYFPWLYRMSDQGPDVHVFAFGTKVENLTPHLHASYQEAVEALYADTDLWGSGTAMGRTFAEWMRRFGGGLLGPHTNGAVISDGWDVGDAARLRYEMRWLKSRCAKLVWFDPYASAKGFRPEVAGLRIALPFVDWFWPLTDKVQLHRLADDLSAASGTRIREVGITR